MQANRIIAVVVAGAAALATAACTRREEKAEVTATRPAAPSTATAAVPSNPLKEAYFGEQHLHTAYSLDAYIGGARLTPVGRLSLREGRGGRGRRDQAPHQRAARLGRGHRPRRVHRRDVLHDGRGRAGPRQRAAQGAARPQDRSTSARSGSSSTWSRTTAARRPSTRPSTPGPRPR